MPSRPRPWIVTDDLWRRVEPLLPSHPRRADGRGRPWRDDRKALCGILFVLHTGLPWRDDLLAAAARLAGPAGVWERLHRLLLEELHAAGQIDWERAAVDGSHVRAMRGGEHTGPSPVDRARPGSKHHLIVEGRGIPLAVSLTGGNRHDCTHFGGFADFGAQMARMARGLR